MVCFLLLQKSFFTNKRRPRFLVSQFRGLRLFPREYLELNPAPRHATLRSLSCHLPRHGQPACWPATSAQPLYNELSSSPGLQTRMLWRLPAFWAPTGRLWRACQLSGPHRPEPLPERMPDRMPADRSIDLSILPSYYLYSHPLASS